jgi:hypothetical protein
VWEQERDLERHKNKSAYTSEDRNRCGASAATERQVEIKGFKWFVTTVRRK